MGTYQVRSPLSHFASIGGHAYGCLTKESCQAWSSQTARYLTFDFLLPSPDLRVQIAEIEVRPYPFPLEGACLIAHPVRWNQLYYPNATKMPIRGCVEGLVGASPSSCVKLYDGRSEPESAVFAVDYTTSSSASFSWTARGSGRARVTLDLGRPPTTGHTIARLVIHLAADMRNKLANRSSRFEGADLAVNVFFGATPLPEGSLSNTSVRFASDFLRQSSARVC